MVCILKDSYWPISQAGIFPSDPLTAWKRYERILQVTVSFVKQLNGCSKQLGNMNKNRMILLRICRIE